ncbi:hypothetical protein F4604DRAFT_1932704 [Suillus subluteus]|nr:hypothetical protein F4604DRAFT_1932704 [Suillus subluteus]
MSSAQQANDALNLVGEKINWLVKRSEKLKASDPAAKTLAHEIAMTLASQLSFAEIRDKSSTNGKLKALPDWGSISDNNPQIRTHPLFPKSVGYWCPQPLTPPAVLAELPAPLPPAPVKPTHAPSPVPPITIIPKAKLFVPGNGNYNGHGKPAPKKARTHLKKQEESRAPQAKSRAHFTKPKSKEFISDDEHDEVPADKSKTTAVPGTQPTIPVAKSKDTKPTDSASEDDALDEDASSVHLFGIQCQRCIKDDIPCAVVLSKKMGEIRKCCRRCDEKKTKCICPTPEEVSILRAATAEKKAKAATKKAQTPAPRTQSMVPVNTRAASCYELGWF